VLTTATGYTPATKNDGLRFVLQRMDARVGWAKTGAPAREGKGVAQGTDLVVINNGVDPLRLQPPEDAANGLGLATDECVGMVAQISMPTRRKDSVDCLQGLPSFSNTRPVAFCFLGQPRRGAGQLFNDESAFAGIKTF